VPSLDYTGGLRLLTRVTPTRATAVLREVAAPLAARDLVVYLVDFGCEVLQPLPDGTEVGGVVVPEEPVNGTVAGRVLREGAAVSQAGPDGGDRVWVPICAHTETLGVLALTVEQGSAEMVAACVELGAFAGLVLVSASRYTDLVRARRYGKAMSLSASMQWDMLPPLTAACEQASVAGAVEPAYDVGGDAFDYAVNTRWLDVALFDGMGHAVASSQLAGITVGAYRHARREADSLELMHARIDDVVNAHYERDAFATGVIARLHLDTGALERTNAGHPLPLLAREGKVTELACVVSLPFGFAGRCEGVGRDQLQPGDRVLFYSDGVIEARDDEGQEFGAGRVADVLRSAVQDSRSDADTARAVVDAARAHQADRLRDDATAVVVTWIGSTSASG
jgi:hypothetical protein